MTLVTSSGWLPEAEERRNIRDDARARFRGRIGLKPLKSMNDLSFSPEQQISVVKQLMAGANGQSGADIDRMLQSLSSAIADVGLGAGGLMAMNGLSKLNFKELVPQELAKWHFLGDADE